MHGVPEVSPHEDNALTAVHVQVRGLGKRRVGWRGREAEKPSGAVCTRGALAPRARVLLRLAVAEAVQTVLDAAVVLPAWSGLGLGLGVGLGLGQRARARVRASVRVGAGVRRRPWAPCGDPRQRRGGGGDRPQSIGGGLGGRGGGLGAEGGGGGGRGGRGMLMSSHSLSGLELGWA